MTIQRELEIQVAKERAEAALEDIRYKRREAEQARRDAIEGGYYEGERQ